MFLQDLRYALRSLVKDGKVSAIVITCLALGIGLNVTMFSVVDGVMIQPLPFGDPERLVILNSTFERGGIRRGNVSYADLKDWKATATSFAAIAASSNRSLAISDGSAEPERFSGALVSWDLFPTLGVNPALGRPFGPEDDRPGAEPVVILGDAVWQRRYQADPSIIGRSILVNARPHTVVGVMPPQFAFPQNERVWIPMGPILDSDPRNVRALLIVARLRDGVAVGAAQSELSSVASRLAAAHPTTNEGWGASIRPFREFFVPADVKLMLSTMMGAVTLVLLIACSNVANLMLARASGRQREFSVRAAMGAGRARLIRQLLTECLAVALAAAPLGLLVAWVGVVLLRNAMPVDSVPYTVQWQIDARTTLYAVAVAALTGLVFGLAPAIQAGRVSLIESLRDGSRGSGTSGRRARLRNALVAVEVALALVLLVGAALFVRSFANLQTASVGFDTAPLLGMRFFMAGDGYATDQARADRVEDILRRVESQPGVQSAFASNYLPLQAGGGGGQVIVDGRSVEPGEEPNIALIATTPHLHRTLGMSMLRGRDFTDAEGTSKSAVAVIDNTMAQRLWPGEDPVGRRFSVVGGDPPDTFTVIGVAPMIGRDNPDDDRPPMPAAFIAYPYAATPNTALTVRTGNDPASMANTIRGAIRDSDSNIPVFIMRTMEEFRRLSFWQQRLFGIMFAVFGAVALLLAAVGVYGVLAFAVSQRTQEIGLRMALGAEQGDVQRMVVRQGLTLASAGIVLGLLGAFGVTRVIATQLYNVTPTDPLSFGSVTAFLALIALAASYFPARRATAIDPNVALRME